jgi:hypothetical protein
MKVSRVPSSFWTDRAGRQIGEITYMVRSVELTDFRTKAAEYAGSANHRASQAIAPSNRTNTMADAAAQGGPRRVVSGISGIAKTAAMARVGALCDSNNTSHMTSSSAVAS